MTSITHSHSGVPVIDNDLLFFIEEKLFFLEKTFGKVVETHVTLSEGIKNELFHRIAEVRIKLPNKILIIRESSKTFEIAVIRAVLRIKEQLGKKRHSK